MADAALLGAFVPVFSELLEQKKRKEAIDLAGALAGLLLSSRSRSLADLHRDRAVADPLFTGDEFRPRLDTLAVGLSQVLFPIIVLLGLTGLVTGILNIHDHFTIPAIAPLVWNLVIIAGMVRLAPLFEGDNQLYAYAIGVVAGTLVQLLMMLPTLRRMGFRSATSSSRGARDEQVKRVLLLMLPVSIGLGLVNINLLLNTVIGSTVSDQVPRAIDAAFRIYMYPRRCSPSRSRPCSSRSWPGSRPATTTRGCGDRRHRAAADRPAADPRRRGDGRARRPDRAARLPAAKWNAESTALTADALFWFAFSLPFSGFVLMLTRGFFSIQQPSDPDQARGRLARHQRGRLLPAGQAVRDRGHRARHDRVQRRARRGRGEYSCGRPRRVRDARDAHGDGEDAVRGGPCWLGVAYGVWAGPGRSCSGESLIAQIVAALHRAGPPASAAYVAHGSGAPDRRGDAPQILDLFLFPSPRRPLRETTRNLRNPNWPTSRAYPASRSSRTSTMASRRWRTGSWSPAKPSTPRAMRAQLLDSMDLERERGSRSRRRPCASSTTAQDGGPASST